MIGKELRALILEEKIRAKDLSQILGMLQSTISNYLNDTSSPDVKTLRIIKQRYKNKTDKNINLDWLITGEGEMFITKD